MRLLYRGRHRATPFTQSVDDIKADLAEQELAERRRKAEEKRLLDKWLCDNRTGDWHLNADGTYYCWHTKMAFAPGWEPTENYILAIEVPDGQHSLPTLNQMGQS